MMRALFRWYVGDPDTPCWFYPMGWRWIQPSIWEHAKGMTKFSTYLWKKGGERALLDFVVHKLAVPFVPWNPK